MRLEKSGGRDPRKESAFTPRGAGGSRKDLGWGAVPSDFHFKEIPTDGFVEADGRAHKSEKQ